jgi:hypothetical protein
MTIHRSEGAIVKSTIRLITIVMITLTGNATLAQSGDPKAVSPMATMHQTMQQIRETEDPERRAELLETHLNEMHAIMERMHADMGELMQGMEAQKQETKRLHDHRKMK